MATGARCITAFTNAREGCPTVATVVIAGANADFYAVFFILLFVVVFLSVVGLVLVSLYMSRTGGRFRLAGACWPSDSPVLFVSISGRTVLDGLHILLYKISIVFDLGCEAVCLGFMVFIAFSLGYETCVLG